MTHGVAEHPVVLCGTIGAFASSFLDIIARRSFDLWIGAVSPRSSKIGCRVPPVGMPLEKSADTSWSTSPAVAGVTPIRVTSRGIRERPIYASVKGDEALYHRAETDRRRRRARARRRIRKQEPNFFGRRISPVRRGSTGVGARTVLRVRGPARRVIRGACWSASSAQGWGGKALVWRWQSCELMWAK